MAREDGAQSADGQIFASYCHGLFDHPSALTALLAWAGLRDAATVDYAARREADLNRLADAVTASLDWNKLRAAGIDLAAAPLLNRPAGP
jgi:adenosylcobyric acid synthase